MKINVLFVLQISFHAIKTHNTSIATDDDIIQFGIDVNIINNNYTLYIYPGLLSFGEIVLIGYKRLLF